MTYPHYNQKKGKYSKQAQAQQQAQAQSQQASVAGGSLSKAKSTVTSRNQLHQPPAIMDATNTNNDDISVVTGTIAGEDADGLGLGEVEGEDIGGGDVDVLVGAQPSATSHSYFSVSGGGGAGGSASSSKGGTLAGGSSSSVTNPRMMIGHIWKRLSIQRINTLYQMFPNIHSSVLSELWIELVDTVLFPIVSTERGEGESKGVDAYETERELLKTLGSQILQDNPLFAMFFLLDRLQQGTIADPHAMGNMNKMLSSMFGSSGLNGKGSGKGSMMNVLIFRDFCALFAT